MADARGHAHPRAAFHGQSRRRPSSTASSSAARRTGASSPMTPPPARSSGRQKIRQTAGRDGAGRADRVERHGLRRQCRRRHQRRQGPHVRARRRHRQDRVGNLPRSRSPTPRTETPSGTEKVTEADLAEQVRHADHRRRDLDLLLARRARPVCSTCRAAIRRPISSRALRPGHNLLAGSVVVLDAKTGALRQRIYSLVPEDFHDWDISATPALFTTKGGALRHGRTGKNGAALRLSISTPASALFETAVTTRSNIDRAADQEGHHLLPRRIAAARSGTARPTAPTPT